MFKLSEYKKAFFAAVASGAAMFLEVYSNDSDVTSSEWTKVLGTVLVAGIGTGFFKNSEKVKEPWNGPERLEDDYS